MSETKPYITPEKEAENAKRHEQGRAPDDRYHAFLVGKSVAR